MGRRSYPGGVISGAEPSVSGARASGMWSLQTAAQKRTANEWPIPGVEVVVSNTSPIISNVAVTDSNYTVLNDTPYISSTGGFIRITGVNFASGAVVYVGGSAAVTTSFVSSTELRAQIGAGSSNTFPVYVVNADNGTGIKLAAITYSGSPSWSTGASLTSQAVDTAFSISLSATSDSAITYTLDTGSALPPGTTLYTNGVFAGTVTGITVDTAYSFSVVANDAENQDASRTFTVTVVLGDVYFYLTPLLLKGDVDNTWITDASTNQYSITVTNDARSSAFSPYATYWSGYFDGTGDFLTIGNTSLYTFGTSAYTIEFWFFGEPSIADYKAIAGNGTFSLYFISSSIQLWNGASPVFQPTMSPTVPRSRWTFIQIIRTSTASNGLAFYIDGTLAATGTDGTNWTATGTSYFFTEGSRPATGFVTDLRVSNVARTPGVPTAPLTSDANTRVLTLQNRRFVDNSSNALTITGSGDAGTRSFTPYAENATTVGSAYFDGTGDYLTIGTAANWALLHNSAAQWTIDFWVYPITYNGSLLETCDSSSQTGIFLGFTAGGLLVLQIMRGVTSSFVMDITGNIASQKYNWSHIQISYDFSLASNNVSIHVNGVANTASAGSFTKTANAPSSSNPTSPLYVGYSTSSQFQGYIADLRVRTGIAVSTAPTLPTTSVSRDANTQLLALQYRQGENNHRFLDESPVKAITTRTGNPSMGSFSPFAQQGWSVSFDGNGDYINVATNAALALGTGDFTIECWVNLSTTSGTYIPFMQSSSSTSSASNVIWFFAYASNLLILQTHASGGFTCTTAWTPVTGRWYHVAAVRQSGTIRLFVDGVSGAVSTTGTPSGYSLGEAGMAVGMMATPYYLTGFISNARVVKGFALYTATFTPPTTSLSVVSGTILLTARSATNGFDITGQGFSISLLGDAKTRSFSPFSKYTADVYNAAYSPAVHGGSAYFDGTGDYLYISTTVASYLGTNNHTVEFWMYPDGTQAQYSVPWYYDGSIVYYFSIGSNAPADVSLLLGGGSPWSVQLSAGNAEYVKILNTWTHVVITRSGTAFRMFLNGKLVGYGTAAQSIAAPNPRFSIGWDLVNATTLYKGWISNFRIINGSIPTAYQTASTTTGTQVFSIPTAVPALDANTVMQTTFTSASIYDVTGRSTIETVGTVRVSNVASKFGIGSINFGTRTDYLAIPSTPAIATLGGDFTLEAWVYPTDISVSQTWGIIDARQSAGSANAWIWRLDSYSSGWLLNFYTGTNYSSTGRVQANVWTHIATVRSGTTVTFYINGSASGTATVSGVITGTATTNPIFIGTKDTGSGSTYGTVGYIDDLRITNGFARTITLPTSGFLTK